MSRLSEAKGHRDRIHSVFQLPDHQGHQEQAAGAYRELLFGDWAMHIFARTAKNFRYFLLVFVIAITVGPVLRREFFPSEGLVPALGGWLGSLGAGGILLLMAITGGGAFLLGRSVRPRS